MVCWWPTLHQPRNRWYSFDRLTLAVRSVNELLVFWFAVSFNLSNLNTPIGGKGESPPLRMADTELAEKLNMNSDVKVAPRGTEGIPWIWILRLIAACCVSSGLGLALSGCNEKAPFAACLGATVVNAKVVEVQLTSRMCTWCMDTSRRGCVAPFQGPCFNMGTIMHPVDSTNMDCTVGQQDDVDEATARKTVQMYPVGHEEVIFRNWYGRCQRITDKHRIAQSWSVLLWMAAIILLLVSFLPGSANRSLCVLSSLVLWLATILFVIITRIPGIENLQLK